LIFSKQENEILNPYNNKDKKSSKINFELIGISSNLIDKQLYYEN